MGLHSQGRNAQGADGLVACVRWAFLLVPLLVAPILAGCLSDPESDVTVASYPPRYLVERLTADTNLTVAVLGNPNVSLHAYEPSALDLRTLRGSKLVVLHGLGLEHWALGAIDAVGAAMLDVEGSNDPPLGHCHGPCPQPPAPVPQPPPDRVAAVFIASMPGGEPFLPADHIHQQDGTIVRDPSLIDPHTWTDPRAYLSSAARTAQALMQRFPEEAATIEANLQLLRADLLALHDAYWDGLLDCSKDLIATNHNAYAYLAQRYGFSVVALHAIEPGVQPDPQSVQRVLQAIRDLDLQYFFIEEGTDPGVVEAIRRETGVTITTLHALERDPGAGHDYLSRSYENLEALRDALECP